MTDTVPYPCGICLKDVTSHQQGAQCRADCNRWFHKDCAKISTACYSRLASDDKFIWKCMRADCLKNPCQTGDLLSEIKNLTTVVKSLVEKVDNIKTSDLAEIKKDMKSVNTKLESIEDRIYNSEKRIETLEEKVEALEVPKSSVTVSHEDIISEIEERSKRARNIIIHDLPESTSKDIPTRVSHDKDLLKELMRAINFAVDMSTIKLYRVGKQNKDKARPLKVVLSSPDEVKLLFELFTAGKDALKNSNSSISSVGISRDRTDRERQYLSQLRQELEMRTKNGESNLTIKYKNGVPVILKASKNE